VRGAHRARRRGPARGRGHAARSAPGRGRRGGGHRGRAGAARAPARPQPPPPALSHVRGRRPGPGTIRAGDPGAIWARMVRVMADSNTPPGGDPAGNSDKRREARAPVVLRVDYDGPDELVFDYTENLSSRGVFLKT